MPDVAIEIPEEDDLGTVGRRALDPAFERIDLLLQDHAVLAHTLGAGGMKIYAAGLLAGLKEIAARYGVLLIADEVMTGWGRTGTMFACQQAGITPDILCTSKGLTGGAVPLAATLATAEIF